MIRNSEPELELELELAAYRTGTTNACATSGIGTVQFIGERRGKGVETGFNGDITDHWSVLGGYSCLDEIIVDRGYTVFAVPAVTGAVGIIDTPAHDRPAVSQ